MTRKSKKIDQYEKRFGAIAIEKGFITSDQLIDALRIQVMEETGKRKHRLIGTILFEQEIMPYEQIDKVCKVLFSSSK